MHKTLRDLYGTWILFFHYVKWPIFFGLPLLYFDLDYPNNIVMDLLWLYSGWLIAEELWRRFVAKNHCSGRSCQKETGRKERS